MNRCTARDLRDSGTRRRGQHSDRTCQWTQARCILKDWWQTSLPSDLRVIRSNGIMCASGTWEERTEKATHDNSWNTSCVWEGTLWSVTEARWSTCLFLPSRVTLSRTPSSFAQARSTCLHLLTFHISSLNLTSYGCHSADYATPSPLALQLHPLELS